MTTQQSRSCCFNPIILQVFSIQSCRTPYFHPCLKTHLTPRLAIILYPIKQRGNKRSCFKSNKFLSCREERQREREIGSFCGRFKLPGKFPHSWQNRRIRRAQPLLSTMRPLKRPKSEAQYWLLHWSPTLVGKQCIVAAQDRLACLLTHPQYTYEWQELIITHSSIYYNGKTRQRCIQTTNFR